METRCAGLLLVGTGRLRHKSAGAAVATGIPRGRTLTAVLLRDQQEHHQDDDENDHRPGNDAEGSVYPVSKDMFTAFAPWSTAYLSGLA
ncbi:hypothetical protein [Streptomyces decoyicus]|uniref:hypothetical protein n=1 Tax=Streptomyces decoyicus TaxID=249567 RepID=UPI0037F3EFA5